MRRLGWSGMEHGGEGGGETGECDADASKIAHRAQGDNRRKVRQTSGGDIGTNKPQLSPTHVVI